MKETPKQKAIRESYGEYWDKVKHSADDAGWVYGHDLPHLLDAYFEANTESEIEFEKSYNEAWIGSRWRPKSLAGIEDNNGWIRIDDRLPENENTVIVLDGSAQYEGWYRKDGEYWVYKEDDPIDPAPTHWRPKEVYPKPIY